MERNYTTPTIEILSFSPDDIVSTSPTIELPWLPVEDEI